MAILKRKIFITFITLVLFLLCFVAIPFGQGAAYALENEVYTGKVYHIFTHSLILDPNLSFKSNTRDGYNNWMTTKDEFKKALELLYKNDFILIDIDALGSKKADGTVTKGVLNIPKGKKPLIISVDDVNYYDYMKGDGFADRLTVDNQGRVTTVVIKDGKEIIDYEGDVVPILDSFIKEHPDFSHNGAKGVLAVTGYQGVFGYRTTTLEGAAKQNAINEAKKVADALKATGWKIACHSYTHSQKFRDNSASAEKITEELNRWENEIAPITGKTNIFISPFGMHLKASDARMKVLTDHGYYIYCPVDANMQLEYASGVIINTRLNLDGFTMIKYPGRIKKHFFDPSLILDKKRPPMV